MINIDVHTGDGLEIVSEFPENSYSMRLRPRGSNSTQHFTLWTSLDQWHQMRKLMPKAEGYVLSIMGDAPNLREHAEADAWAEEFYNAEKAKLIPDMPPEAPGTDDIVDTPTPAEGDLRGEYESREVYMDGLWHNAPYPRPAMTAVQDADEEEIV